MFELFTEPARRMVFLSRYAAIQLRSPQIDTPHLVLGFVSEDGGGGESILMQAYGLDESAGEAKPQREKAKPFLARETAERLRNRLSVEGTATVTKTIRDDVPLSPAAKRAFSTATDYAKRVSTRGTITPLHLLWGVLQNSDTSLVQSLLEEGLTPEALAAEIQRRGDAGLDD